MKNIRKKILIVFVSSFLISWIPNLPVLAEEKISSTEEISSNTNTSLSSDNNLESSSKNNNSTNDQKETSTSCSSGIETTEITQEPSIKKIIQIKMMKSEVYLPKKLLNLR